MEIRGTKKSDKLNGTDADDLIYGNDGNDRISGGLGNDLLFGEANDDFVDGGAGDDLVDGGVGDDNVIGGDGRDALQGGPGRDRLDGGNGTDTAVLLGHPTDFSWQTKDGMTVVSRLSNGSGPPDVDTMTNVERLQFQYLDGGIEKTETIYLTPNVAPVASNDTFTTAENTLLTVAAAEGMLRNDSDADDDPLALAEINGLALADLSEFTDATHPVGAGWKAADLEHGTLYVKADGSMEYQPDSGYSGPESFSYQVSDGHGGSAAATVAISVTEANPENKVLLFNNGAFVDLVDDYPSFPFREAEGLNLQDFLNGHDFSWTGTTAVDATGLAAALSDRDVFLIPEPEISPITSALDVAAKDAISDWVGAGNRLVVFGTSFRLAADDLINSTFGFSTNEGLSTIGSFSETYSRSAAATDTPLADNPQFLRYNDWTNVLTNLPTGSESYYQDSAGGSAVVAMPYGDGEVFYVGWDWFDGAPTGTQDGGWVNVLSDIISYQGDFI